MDVDKNGSYRELAVPFNNDLFTNNYKRPKYMVLCKT